MIHELSCPSACGILVLGPGIELISPALADGFSTTGPPGKSPSNLLLTFTLEKTLMLEGIGSRRRRGRPRMRWLDGITDSTDASLSELREWVIVQFSSVAQSCPTLCDPMNRSTPGLPVHHQLPEFTQTRVRRVGDVIQPSHPLSSPSPPAPNPSQHQSLFQ